MMAWLPTFFSDTLSLSLTQAAQARAAPYVNPNPAPLAPTPDLSPVCARSRALHLCFGMCLVLWQEGRAVVLLRRLRCQDDSAAGLCRLHVCSIGVSAAS